MRSIKYLSLFSGIGGFELGIHQACSDLGSHRRQATNAAALSGARPVALSGGNDPTAVCVGYSEINRYALQVYQRHFPNHPCLGDITRIDPETLPDFDLLCGGFPCQSFSNAGHRAGFEDPRGALFFEIARIIASKQPRHLLLENVKGFLSHDHGRTAKRCFETLDDLGYDCEWQVLNSKDFGLPQNRERIFIVGHSRACSRSQVFPFLRSVQSCPKTGREAELGQPADCRIRRLTPLECERVQGFPDGWTEGLSGNQRYHCIGNAVSPEVIRQICARLFVS
ncbi:DNA-cytosine methyltransferase [Actibacterium atlanticum]|uniref:Cytosine-specific methyltransferase n=1 Tax=Actibacterium atlanticum TaxID=1461693 RepID=A0A058ZMN2_9RHOB|nr:DNA (cytosine-5-)-methyltransferase [Actibacterium atlanticum]KCV82457.1 DNA-cytosine methyltransferase [Actibacterium atlanticum]